MGFGLTETTLRIGKTRSVALGLNGPGPNPSAAGDIGPVWSSDVLAAASVVELGGSSCVCETLFGSEGPLCSADESAMGSRRCLYVGGGVAECACPCDMDCADDGDLRLGSMCLPALGMDLAVRVP